MFTVRVRPIVASIVLYFYRRIYTQRYSLGIFNPSLSVTVEVAVNDSVIMLSEAVNCSGCGGSIVGAAGASLQNMKKHEGEKNAEMTRHFTMQTLRVNASTEGHLEQEAVHIVALKCHERTRWPRLWPC